MNIDEKVRLLGNLRRGERVELGLQREIFGQFGHGTERSTQLGYFARVTPPEEGRIGPITSIFDKWDSGPQKQRVVLYSGMLDNGDFSGDALYFPVSAVEYFRRGFSSPAGGINDTLGQRAGPVEIRLEP